MLDRRPLARVALPLALLGCAPGTSADVDAKTGDDDSLLEVWRAATEEGAIEIAVSAYLDEMPREGRATDEAWSDETWAAIDDAYNARGDDALSPAEKYDLAFSDWTPPAGFASLRPLTREACASGAWDAAYYDALGPVARAVSEQLGNGRARNAVDDDGDGLVDECDDFDGLASRAPSNEGWAAASALEAAPRDAVERGGVRFEPRDVRALLTLAHRSTTGIAVGDRCARIRSGEARELECRDVDAAAFHRVLTGLVGRERRAVIEERGGASRPVRGYRVRQQQPHESDDVLRILGVEPDARYAHAVRSWVEVVVLVDYAQRGVEESETIERHYLLALDHRGGVIGGEWVEREAPPPEALWLPLGPRAEVDGIAVDASLALELARASRPDDRAVRSLVREVDREVLDWPEPGVASAIEVPEHAEVEQAEVAVELDHPRASDLQIVLHRDAHRVVLFDRNPLDAAEPLRARFAVDAMVGEDAYGQWELYVVDREGQEAGRVHRWALTLSLRGDATPLVAARDPLADATTHRAVGAPIAVPDGLGDGAISAMLVNDEGRVTAARARARVAHPAPEELRFALTHAGARVWLRAEGDGTLITADLRSLEGAIAEGEWQLEVIDPVVGAAGTLVSWDLAIEVR